MDWMDYMDEMDGTAPELLSEPPTPAMPRHESSIPSILVHQSPW